MNLKDRSYQHEILDKDDVPFDDIIRNMQELNFINTWLGGHAISIQGLQQIIGANKQVTICEIGCGGGDNLFAIYDWCNRNRISAHFIGIDQKEACILFAKSRQSDLQSTTWIASDYRKVTFEQMPDVIFSSLFCHHFTNEQLLGQLQWMHQNSRLGFFINDLQRSPTAYHLIKWLTRFFSSSYMVKNDAPLSVARGFKKKEWVNLMQQSGLSDYTLKWKWAFRYLVTCRYA